jgi:hypothetical protein
MWGTKCTHQRSQGLASTLVAIAALDDQPDRLTH